MTLSLPMRGASAPLIFLVVALLSLCVGACQFQGDQTVIDHCPIHDYDCDSISNAVQLHPPNAQYHFNPAAYDANPSVGRGFFDSGTLDSGLNLPDVNLGYYQFLPCATRSGCDPRWDRPDSNDWGILALVNEIEGTSRQWTDPFPATDACSRYTCTFCNDRPVRARQFGTGDMSKYGGGYWLDSDGFERHSWHQNGTEVDVRYLRTDHAAQPLNLLSGDSIFYDLLSTVDLLRCFIATGRVEHILIDTAHTHIAPDGLGIVVHDAAHYNHFHVRVTNVYIP